MASTGHGKYNGAERTQRATTYIHPLMVLEMELQMLAGSRSTCSEMVWLTSEMNSGDPAAISTRDTGNAHWTDEAYAKALPARYVVSGAT